MVSRFFVPVYLFGGDFLASSLNPLSDFWATHPKICQCMRQGGLYVGIVGDSAAFREILSDFGVIVATVERVERAVVSAWINGG